MIQLALIAGVLAVLGFSGVSLSGLVSGVFTVALGLLMLALVLQVAASIFERIARRWIGTPQRGNSVRMTGSHSAF